LSSAMEAISRFPAVGLYSEGAMRCSVTAAPCSPCATPTAASVTLIYNNHLEQDVKRRFCQGATKSSITAAPCGPCATPAAASVTLMPCNASVS